jgi:hypothetical protein
MGVRMAFQPQRGLPGAQLDFITGEVPRLCSLTCLDALGGWGPPEAHFRWLISQKKRRPRISAAGMRGAGA